MNDRRAALELLERSANAIHILKTDYKKTCKLLKTMIIWDGSDESIAEHHNLNIADVRRLREMLNDK